MRLLSIFFLKMIAKEKRNNLCVRESRNLLIKKYFSFFFRQDPLRTDLILDLSVPLPSLSTRTDSNPGCSLVLGHVVLQRVVEKSRLHQDRFKRLRWWSRTSTKTSCRSPSNRNLPLQTTSARQTRSSLLQIPV